MPHHTVWHPKLCRKPASYNDSVLCIHDKEYENGLSTIFSVLLYLGVQNLDVVLKYVKIVWGLLLPFVLGGAMAFVLNVPMAFIERHVFGKAKEKENRRGKPLFTRGQIS